MHKMYGVRQGPSRRLGFSYRKVRRERKGSSRRKPTSPNLFFNVRKNVFFRRSPGNVIFEVTSTQLPAMKGLGLTDLFLTKGHIREPHWHPNANELDYVVSGEVIISVLDPLTHRLITYHVKVGQVVFIPMNWWHWSTAVSDKAHVVEMFNNEQFQIAEGSDILRLTPPKVFKLAYNVNAKELAKVLRPIKETVVIGPPHPERNKIINESMNTMGTNQSGSPNLFFDVRKSVSFRRDERNILFEVTSTQLPALQRLALVDIFLSKEHIVEPHWHPNVNEMSYTISGKVTVSILNPFSLELLTYQVKAGQVTFIPKGWWHWITAVSEEEAHLLAIFDDNKIEEVDGSDVLRLTPPEVFHLAYGVNTKQLAEVLEPIDQTVVIGPPNS